MLRQKTPKIAESILEKTNNEDTEKVEHHESESNHEISINYIQNKKIWNRNEQDDLDDAFSYIVSS